MAAIEDRKDVQWLFDQMNAAESHGHLLTVKHVIEIEKSDENEYTKDEELMQRLRQCYGKNWKRIELSRVDD